MRNYWVVSPNVYKENATEDSWKSCIMEYGYAFLGYNDDHELGRMFKNIVKIDDCIIIAQGANRLKRLFIAGLVKTNAEWKHLSGTPGPAQCRQLENIIAKDRLEKLINFNEECAFGSTNQVVAIYKLYPEKSIGDKAIIDTLECEFERITREKKAIIYVDLLNANKNLILTGAPGTGKTYTTAELALQVLEQPKFSDRKALMEAYKKAVADKQIAFTTFHQSMDYEEFVEGLKPDIDKTTKQGTVTYSVKDGIFKSICKRARDNEKQKYVLIIDEINRGNVSKVLGELITLLEKDKRLGEENGIEVTLPYSQESFGVPSNLYIIGTMNTADRSIGHIDYAIRRRFAFYSVKSDIGVIEGYKNYKDNTKDIAENLFKEIKSFIDKNLNADLDVDDLMIGHSYFLCETPSELKSRLEYEIIPLLEEYNKDGIINVDKEKLKETFKEWKDNLWT